MLTMKKTLILNTTQINHFLFVTGILTALPHTTMSLLRAYNLRAIILMQFLYQRHILTLPQQLMINILKLLDITF